jgi:hypothetical protein
MNDKPLLRITFPALADELVDLLNGASRQDLADQVPTLRVFDRCRCGDDFCSTIYFHQPPKGSWGKNHQNLSLEADTGMIILDVASGKLVCAEILYRPEFRTKLLLLLP